MARHPRLIVVWPNPDEIASYYSDSTVYCDFLCLYRVGVCINTTPPIVALVMQCVVCAIFEGHGDTYPVKTQFMIAMPPSPPIPYRHLVGDRLMPPAGATARSRHVHGPLPPPLPPHAPHASHARAVDGADPVHPPQLHGAGFTPVRGAPRHRIATSRLEISLSTMSNI